MVEYKYGLLVLLGVVLMISGCISFGPPQSPNYGPYGSNPYQYSPPNPQTNPYKSQGGIDEELKAYAQSNTPVRCEINATINGTNKHEWMLIMGNNLKISIEMEDGDIQDMLIVNYKDGLMYIRANETDCDWISMNITTNATEEEPEFDPYTYIMALNRPYAKVEISCHPDPDINYKDFRPSSEETVCNLDQLVMDAMNYYGND